MAIAFRGQFYFAAEGHSYFACEGQRRLPSGGKHARLFQEAQRRVNLMKNIITDNGGSISRKELTEKLIEELKLSRTRVANLISEQLKSTICENNKLIQIQPELDWPI